MHEKEIKGFDYVLVNYMHSQNIFYFIFSIEWVSCMKRTFNYFLSLLVKYMHEKEFKGFDYVWVNYIHSNIEKTVELL